MRSSPGAHSSQFSCVREQVLQQIMRMWKQQGHRMLLFCQTRQMLDILDDMLQTEGYKFRRIDGSTSVKNRLPIIDTFNRDPTIFAMLLTTRAGDSHTHQPTSNEHNMHIFSCKRVMNCRFAAVVQGGWE